MQDIHRIHVRLNLLAKQAKVMIASKLLVFSVQKQKLANKKKKEIGR